MENLTIIFFDNGLVTIEGIEYTLTGAENLGNCIHIFLANEINNPVICLIPGQTVINSVTCETVEVILEALGNPVELSLNTL